jgi:hypothetical protein
MITLPAFFLACAEHTRKALRTYAFEEMKQIATGWGLTKGYPSPDTKQRPAIDLQFSERSRRTLFKNHRRTPNLPLHN